MDSSAILVERELDESYVEEDEEIVFPPPSESGHLPTMPTMTAMLSRKMNTRLKKPKPKRFAASLSVSGLNQVNL